MIKFLPNLILIIAVIASLAFTHFKKRTINLKIPYILAFFTYLVSTYITDGYIDIFSIEHRLVFFQLSILIAGLLLFYCPYKSKIDYNKFYLLNIISLFCITIQDLLVIIITLECSFFLILNILEHKNKNQFDRFINLISSALFLIAIFIVLMKFFTTNLYELRYLLLSENNQFFIKISLYTIICGILLRWILIEIYNFNDKLLSNGIHKFVVVIIFRLLCIFTITQIVIHSKEIVDYTPILIFASLLAIITSIVSIFSRKIYELIFFISAGKIAFALISIFCQAPVILNGFIISAISDILLTCGILSFLMYTEKDSVTFYEFSGLFYCKKFSAICLMFLLASGIGIPPFFGFWGQFFSINALFWSNYTLLACILILCNICSVYLFIRIASIIFTPKPSIYVTQCGSSNNYKFSIMHFYAGLCLFLTLYSMIIRE